MEISSWVTVYERLSRSPLGAHEPAAASTKDTTKRWADVRITIPEVPASDVPRVLTNRAPTESDDHRLPTALYRHGDQFYREVSTFDFSTRTGPVDRPFAGLAARLEILRKDVEGAICRVDEQRRQQLLVACAEPKLVPIGPRGVTARIDAIAGVGFGQLHLLPRSSELQARVAHWLRLTQYEPRHFRYDVLCDHSPAAAMIRGWLHAPSLADSTWPRRLAIAPAGEAPQWLREVVWKHPPQGPAAAGPALAQAGATLEVTRLSNCRTHLPADCDPMVAAFRQQRARKLGLPVANPSTPTESEEFCL